MSRSGPKAIAGLLQLKEPTERPAGNTWLQDGLRTASPSSDPRAKGWVSQRLNPSCGLPETGLANTGTAGKNIFDLCVVN
jgi:hypothetical protein